MVAHQTKKPPKQKPTKTKLPPPHKILNQMLTTKNKQKIIATTIHHYHNHQNTTQKIKQTLKQQDKIIIKNISFGFLSARIVVYWFFVSSPSTLLAALFLTAIELYLYGKVFNYDEVF